MYVLVDKYVVQLINNYYLGCSGVLLNYIPMLLFHTVLLFVENASTQSLHTIYMSPFTILPNQI